MARTFRNLSPTYGIRIRIERVCIKEDDRYTYVFEDFNYQSVFKHGWRHARQMVSAKDYAVARKERGDCGTKFYLNGSLPKYWRKISTKVMRSQWKNERAKFLKNPEHEIALIARDRFSYNYW